MSKEPELGNSILSILGGAAAVFLTGLILFPLEQLVADKYFEFSYKGKAANVREIIFFGSLIVWISLATFMGGLVCSFICYKYEFRHALVLSLISFLLYVFFTFADPITKEQTLFIILFVIITCGAYFLGAKVGINYKRKKRNNETLNLGE